MYFICEEEKGGGGKIKTDSSPDKDESGWRLQKDGGPTGPLFSAAYGAKSATPHGTCYGCTGFWAPLPTMISSSGPRAASFCLFVYLSLTYLLRHYLCTGQLIGKKDFLYDELSVSKGMCISIVLYSDARVNIYIYVCSSAQI